MSLPPPPDASGTPEGGPPPPSPPYAPSAGPKVSVNWTGFLMVVGAIVAAVGTFLPFEKLTVQGQGTFTIGGLGSVSTTGGLPENLFTVGKPGLLPLVAAIIVLILGILVVLRQGRLWVSIVALVVALVGTLVAVVALANPSSDADKFGSNFDSPLTGSIGIGAVLTAVGIVVAAVASLLALIVRRPRT